VLGSEVVGLLRFLRRRKRKSSSVSSRKGRVADSFQRQIDRFQPPPQEERRPLSHATSFREIEDEANGYLAGFESYVEQIRETSLRLEELAKLLKSGDISESAYGLIMDELGEALSLSVAKVFELREVLELAKAKAKLEWAKEKVSTPTSLMGTLESMSTESVKRYKDVVESDYWREDFTAHKVYTTNLQRWEDLISKIDAALSSLSIEEETAIIEHYLSFINEKLSLEAGSDTLKTGLSVCRQRLGSILERWTVIKRSRIERVMNLELEATNTRDEIKEAEVRFAVGEIEQELFEHKMSVLQSTLKKVEKEISEIRSFIDDMDMKIFRCTELSRESQ